MADATYQPKVYRDQGGDRLTVVSGGGLKIEAGSTFSVATSATFTGAVSYAGNVDVNGTILHPVTTVSTAQTVTNTGITVLSGTAGTTISYALPAPVAGVRKTFLRTKDGGSTSQTVSTTATAATIGTTGITKVAFKNAEQAVTLVGASATLWIVESAYGSPVLS